MLSHISYPLPSHALPLTSYLSPSVIEITPPGSPQNSSQNGQVVANSSGLGRVVGVGVDLDPSALSAANSNAARASLTGVCRWACHDFAQLADERVRRDLERAVNACEEAAQSNDRAAPVKVLNDSSAASHSNKREGDGMSTTAAAVAAGGGFTPLRHERDGLFDVIVCNPPYLSAPSVGPSLRIVSIIIHNFKKI